MSELEVGLIVAASFVAYLFGVGATFAHLDASGHHSSDDPFAVLGAIAWPVVVVVLLGVAFSKLTRRTTIPSAKVVRRG